MNVQINENSESTTRERQHFMCVARSIQTWEWLSTQNSSGKVLPAYSSECSAGIPTVIRPAGSFSGSENFRYTTL